MHHEWSAGTRGGKFDTPVEATTPSLEALKAFSEGGRTARRAGDTEVIAFYKRATELDPNFALAYAALGATYFNLSQVDLAAENATKVYKLRDHVSDRERYRISTTYYHAVTGDLEKAIKEYVLWSKSSPRIPATFKFRCRLPTVGVIRQGGGRDWICNQPRRMNWVGHCRLPASTLCGAWARIHGGP